MKVFGIGLNKTGTTSLGLAFEALGLCHLDRRPALFKLFRQSRFDAIFEAIEPYDAFQDWPWPLMVPQLLARYGTDAKFVLTRRASPEVWLTSIKAHALRTHPVRNPRKLIYGAAYPHGAEQLYLDKYAAHLAQMRDLFATHGAQSQLLEMCFEDGDGWKQLCEFLETSVITTSFPRANTGSKADLSPERLAENLAAIEVQKAK